MKLKPFAAPDAARAGDFRPQKRRCERDVDFGFGANRSAREKLDRAGAKIQKRAVFEANFLFEAARIFTRGMNARKTLRRRQNARVFAQMPLHFVMIASEHSGRTIHHTNADSRPKFVVERESFGDFERRRRETLAQLGLAARAFKARF